MIDEQCHYDLCYNLGPKKSYKKIIDKGMQISKLTEGDGVFDNNGELLFFLIFRGHFEKKILYLPT